MKKGIWILEIVLMGVIPSLLIGFDYFEGSPPYNLLFNFEPIEKSIVYRFLSLDPPYGNDNQPEVKRILNRQLEPDDFYSVLKLIKKHTSVILPDKEPQLVSAFAIQNAPYVMLPGGQRILIPDSMPIAVSYCYESELVDATCKGDNVVIVGTVGDFKDWLEDEKKEIRKEVNLIVTLISISLGLIIFYRESKKSHLLLNE